MTPSEETSRYQMPSSARSPSESEDFSRDKRAFKRAAESLRQRIASTREYEIISETEKNPEDIEKSGFESWIWNSEYEKSLRLERDLIRKYKGKINLSADLHVLRGRA